MLVWLSEVVTGIIQFQTDIYPTHYIHGTDLKDGIHMSVAKPHLKKSHLFYMIPDEDDFYIKIVAFD